MEQEEHLGRRRRAMFWELCRSVYLTCAFQVLFLLHSSSLSLFNRYFTLTALSRNIYYIIVFHLRMCDHTRIVIAILLLQVNSHKKVWKSIYWSLSCSFCSFCSKNQRVDRLSRTGYRK